jgi:hypothetical protein
MLIQGKRILKLTSHLPASAIGSNLIIGVSDIQRFQKKLEQAGFKDFAEGESVLPATTFGSKSRFNADGKDEPQKHLAKEEVCWMREWCWKQWRGKNPPEEVCDLRDQCRERYPRKHIPAPCIYLTIATNPQGKKIVISPLSTYDPDYPTPLLHIINLFLEIFGECEIFQENLEAMVKVPIRRKNWRILPGGPYPWNRIYQELEETVKQAPRGNQKLIWDRLQHISQHEPKFLAVGEGGFKGYFVLAFPGKNLFFLESLACNNATYVLGEDWEKLSKLTKAEILNESLHKERLIHRRGWHQRVRDLLG